MILILYIGNENAVFSRRVHLLFAWYCIAPKGMSIMNSIVHKDIMQKNTQESMFWCKIQQRSANFYCHRLYNIHWALRLIINTECTFIYDNNHGNDCNNASFWTQLLKSLTANHINIDRSWANRILPNDSRNRYSIPIFHSCHAQ